MRRALLALMLSCVAVPGAYAATGSFNYTGVVTTSSIAGVNVGDLFTSSDVFTFEPSAGGCRYANVDPCGWSGSGYATFNVAAAPIAGTASYDVYRSRTTPSGDMAYRYAFTSSDGVVSSVADFFYDTGFYQDRRGQLTLGALNVPEASSWAMFIAGFGVVGAALRRRRATVRFA